MRPWLQAFPYGVTGFDEQYVTEQILAARDAGAQGWMLWHPANRFDVSLEAMRTLHNGRVVESLRRPPELLGKQTVEVEPDM